MISYRINVKFGSLIKYERRRTVQWEFHRHIILNMKVVLHKQFPQRRPFIREKKVTEFLV